MSEQRQEINNMRRKKGIGILILAIVLLFITIGFALLTSSFNIKGTSTVVNSVWDIHFDNLVPTPGSVTPDVEATIDSDGLIINYTVTLDKPGDFYEFTVDVVNEGTIDAKLAELPEVTGVSAEQDVYVNYSFTHTDGSEIEVGEVIKSGESENFTVRVEFDDNITDDSQLPKSNQTMNLDVEMNYQQK